jgi:hypothetical protein
MNPSVIRIGWLMAATMLAACRLGGEDDPVGGVPAPSPAPAEFSVVSGGAACGGSCDLGGGDGGGGGGGSGGSGGGDGAGGGLGEMRNVVVAAYKPDGKRTPLGSAALADNLVSLYPGTYTGALILEFASDATGNGGYYDESAKKWIALGAQTLHVLIPELKHHVSATPLTESAYQWALKTYGNGTDEPALTAAQMQTANDTVLAAFNARTPPEYRLSDITNYASAVSDKTPANSLPDTVSGRYGTLLAAMPRAASAFNPALAAPALAYLKQLAADLRDDDEVNDSVDPGSERAYDTAMPTWLSDAVVDAKTDYGAAQQPEPTPAPTTCFNTALFTVGTKWSLVYAQTGSESPGELALTEEVTRTTSFEGTSGLLEVKVDIPGSGSTLSYYGAGLDAGLTSYGSLSDLGSSGTYRTVYTPPYTSRQFLLRPGESESLTIASEGTFFDAAGNIVSGPTPFSDTQTTTFVGYEDVTLADLTTYRNACRYETARSDGSEPETTWFTSSGQGVVVKYQSGGFVQELKSGTVNGAPVR